MEDIQVRKYCWLYIYFLPLWEAIRPKEPVGGKKIAFEDFQPRCVFSSHIQNEETETPSCREWLLNGSTIQSEEGLPLPGQPCASFSKHLTWFRWLVECVTALISRRTPRSLCRRCSIPKRTRLPAAKEPGDLLLLCLGPQVPGLHPSGSPAGLLLASPLGLWEYWGPHRGCWYRCLHLFYKNTFQDSCDLLDSLT